MNIQAIAPIIGTTISIGTIIYHTGKHSSMLDNLGTTVYALGKKDELYDKTLCEINSNIGIINEKLRNIDSNLKEIKSKLK